MKDGIYKELFTLVRHEGERLIVINPDTDEGVVVMRLSEFKKLTEGSKEMVVEPQVAEIEGDAPILAKNDVENLSFWENPNAPSARKVSKLDNAVDSGRIHERKSATASDKEEFELVPEDSPKESEEEPAGDEYYFEPAEEIGL